MSYKLYANTRFQDLSTVEHTDRIRFTRGYLTIYEGASRYREGRSSGRIEVWPQPKIPAQKIE